jgi:hypothetical protein
MGSFALVAFEAAPNCVRVVALVPYVVRLRREVGQRETGVLRWPTPVSRMMRESNGAACGLGSAKVRRREVKRTNRRSIVLVWGS